MYTQARRHRPLFRFSAAVVAFVYAYFGFVASLHHTDGFVPTGKPLAISALDCPCAHTEITTDSGAPECGVCEFQASLKNPALPQWTANSAPDYRPQVATYAQPDFTLLRSNLYSPRGPPTA